MAQEIKTVMMDLSSGENLNNNLSYSITIFDGNSDFYDINLKTYKKDTVTFGRNSDNDIVLNSALVSRHHGYFDLSGGEIKVSDIGSTNGIWVNGVKTMNAVLRKGDILRIDRASQEKPDGVLILISDVTGTENWHSMDLTDSIRIGRGKTNDIVLTHAGVSMEHACIKRNGNDVVIEDHHSTNGTFVNGRRIITAALHEKDIITILNTKLIYSCGKLYFYTYQAGLRIDAQHVTRIVRNRRKKICICEDVSLSIEPGSLIAIIGGSGAGKTTFMNAISGYDRPTSGSVLINGEDLYQNYDALKNIIGYVPQEDIVYDNLTLYDMLSYAAKLRLPDDTTKAEREDRVRSVIEMVELSGKEATLIRRLSGGQKKRASIAVELLADPILFFLDEPASGLDPGTERNLMKLLHKMTLKGKTIVLVTHSTLNLQECEKIIFMGTGGKLSYYGSAEEAKDFFQVDDLVDIYNLINTNPDVWQNKYRELNAQEHVAIGTEASGRVVERNKHKWLRQVVVLSNRYMKLVWNDRQRLLLLLIQAPVLAFLISLVKDGNEYYESEITRALLFALACSAFWLGTLNSIQEICKERTILRREYMTGVHLGPYVISKFVVLGILSLLQSMMLTGLFVVLVGTPEKGVITDPAAEFLITNFLTAFASVSTGLFISSLFTNADRAMTVAPLMLMPQILFSGILFKLEGATEIISCFAVSRWAMEGLGTTANINSLKYIIYVGGIRQEYNLLAEEYFTFTVGHMVKVWVILIVFIVVFGVLSTLNLKRIKKNR